MVAKVMRRDDSDNVKDYDDAVMLMIIMIMIIMMMMTMMVCKDDGERKRKTYQSVIDCPS